MTTLTPTANPAAFPQATAHAPLPGGLPDPATLARLANEFFSSLPGSAGAPEVAAGSGAVGGVPSALPAAAPILASLSNPAPAGSPLAGPGGTGTGVPGFAPPQGKLPGANLAPSAPTHVLALGNRAPALAPHAAAANGLPDNAVQIAPALEPRVGGALLGVPQAYAAAEPVPAEARAAAGERSPFYFTESAGHGWQREAQEIAVPTHGLAAPETFGLPGDDALRGLLTLNRPEYDAHDGPARYFLDGRENAAPRTPQQDVLRGAHPPFDVNAVRRDFPILQERVNGKQLVWFDNAATTH
ncbi:MAG TPA: cysteine desulfurase, partial [Paraburkholderia sp.]